MRILLYAGVDLSVPGGLERHVRELALELAARGHEVEILGRPATLPPFRMVDRVDPARYDVIHHHGSVWPRGLDAGTRYVRTFHFCTAAKMERYLRIGRLRTLLNPGNWTAVADERRSVRRPGRLIAVAPRLARELTRFYGVAPERITMIPNGASFAAPSEPRGALRERHGIDADAPVLLTIGREDYVKGYDLLERAWHTVLRALPQAVWVAVGGGTPARLPGRVIAGPVPYDQVARWIAAADIGAMPSYYEGCGLAALEMLAGGLYVIAHDVGIIPEAIRPSLNGEIVEPSPAAWSQTLIESLTRRPRGAGLDQAFRWDHIAAQVEQLYREVAAAGGTAPALGAGAA